MKKLLVLILCLAAFPVFSQNFEQDSAWIVDNYTKTEQYITMRDGARLFTTIYAPKDATEDHPILMPHSNYDAFWQARNPMNHMTNIKPAMMVVGGLFDAEDCYGAWRLYEAIESKSSGANCILGQSKTK